MKTEQEIRKHVAAVKKLMARARACGCCTCTVAASCAEPAIPILEWVLDNNHEYDRIAENAAKEAASIPG